MLTYFLSLATKASALLRGHELLRRHAPLRRDDVGATAVEYGLIAAVIAVVVGLLGQQVSSAFNAVLTNF